MYKKEAITFIKYLNDNLKSINCMTNNSALFLTELFSGKMNVPLLLPHEAPDILLIVGDKTIFLEHFRFDSSEQKNGGSLLKEEIAKFVKNNTEKGFHITSIKNNATLENYTKNLMCISENHIKKYQNYVDKISKHNMVQVNSTFITIPQKNKEFGFVIQDDSLDYNLFVNHKGIDEYLTPFHIPIFRNFLKEHPDIKHIFHIVLSSNEKRVVFYFYNDTNEIDTLEFIMKTSNPKNIKEAVVIYWKNND